MVSLPLGMPVGEEAAAGEPHVQAGVEPHAAWTPPPPRQSGAPRADSGGCADDAMEHPAPWHREASRADSGCFADDVMEHPAARQGRAPRAESRGHAEEMVEHPAVRAAVSKPGAGAPAGRVRGGRPAGTLNLQGSRGLCQRKAGEQKKAAAVVKCKLCVHYEEGEEPMSEMLRLTGGQGADVIVEAVAPNSKAERAGVKAGFALVALNGRDEFRQLPGWQVRLLLEAPITLGFNADAVQPQAPKCTEIRLTRAQDTLGIPSRVAVCGPRESGLLAEEVVFNQGSAPLWLSAWGEEGLGEAPDVAAKSAVPRLYELRRPEAHAMVGKIRGAVEQPPPHFEAEWFQGVSSQSPRRALSPTTLCSIDCVAECLDNELVFGPDQVGRKASGQRPDRGALQTSRSRGQPGAQSPRAAKPSPAGAGREEPKARTLTIGSAIRDDRSPLRWLAPVLERVWGESSSPRGGAASPPKVPARDPRRGGPRPAVARGSSPKPVGAKGDDHTTPMDLDLSATAGDNDGTAVAVCPVVAAAALPGAAVPRRGFLTSSRSDVI
uniref:PDZ domain-containing protein n=1 Tax=Alexandrium catenella TaxID=2925 RepID=A0A7S1WCA5_ALECA